MFHEMAPETVLHEILRKKSSPCILALRVENVLVLKFDKTILKK